MADPSTEQLQPVDVIADAPDVHSELVSPWTVLMAVRYGLGRPTYAHADALALMVRHWPALRQFKTSIVADLEAQARTGMNEEIRATSADALNWIEMAELTA